jgi:hypothetical protein
MSKCYSLYELINYQDLLEVKKSYLRNCKCCERQYDFEVILRNHDGVLTAAEWSNSYF